MKRILVGVDGSKEALGAANFAADLALATSAKLTLVFIIPATDVALGPEDLVARRARWVESQMELAEAELRRVADSCARPNLAIQTEVFEGAPAITLADIALAKDIDLVVVGHRGRTAVARLLLGSVADRLVQISPKPVLVFRAP